MKNIVKQPRVAMVMTAFLLAPMLGLIPGTAKPALAAQNCLPNAFFGSVTVDGVATDGVAVTLTNVTSVSPALSATTSTGGLYLIESANLEICATVGDQIELAASLGGSSASTTVAYAAQATTRVDLAIVAIPQADTTPPVITLNGVNPVNVLAGAAYVDSGATALDDVDGDKTGSINVTGLPIDTSVPGAFTVTYSVSDIAGNLATATRTVNVVAALPIVDRVNVIPDVKNLTVGETFQFAAEARDVNNVALNPQPSVVWSMQNNDVTVGSVDTNGLFTATAAGITTVVATMDGVSGGADVTVADIVLPPPVDNVAPVITILGANPVNITVGTAYADAGATASDNIDGDRTTTIQTTGNVNTAVAGTYTVTYAVTDAAGNQTTAFRTINVAAVPVVPPVPPVTPVSPVTPPGQQQQVAVIETGSLEIGELQITNVTGNAATLSWITNNPSSSEVVFGANKKKLQSQAADGQLSTSHSVTIQDLKAKRNYYFRILAANPDGSGLVQTGVMSFKTGRAARPEDPVQTGGMEIDNVSVTSPASSSVNLSWISNEASDSHVLISTSKGKIKRLRGTGFSDNATGSIHSVTIEGLKPGKKYYYRVIVDRPDGNGRAITGVLSFRAP